MNSAIRAFWKALPNTHFPRSSSPKRTLEGLVGLEPRGRRRGKHGEHRDVDAREPLGPVERGEEQPFHLIARLPVRPARRREHRGSECPQLVEEHVAHDPDPLLHDRGA